MARSPSSVTATRDLANVGSSWAFVESDPLGVVASLEGHTGDLVLT